jgi:GTPase-associated protein 1, N-terminal domain type 1
MHLSGDAISELTHLSDIAPGAVFGSSDSYWSGLPMPKLGRFVLMRTWPAPEMSRPGCVWTHALLLDTAIFEELQDLSALRQLTRRPDGLGGYSLYSQLLELSTADSNPSPISRTEGIEELLLALYGDSAGPILVDAPGEVDDAVFAVWSAAMAPPATQLPLPDGGKPQRARLPGGAFRHQC